MDFVVLTAGKSASYVEGIKICCPNVEQPRPYCSRYCNVLKFKLTSCRAGHQLARVDFGLFLIENLLSYRHLAFSAVKADHQVFHYTTCKCWKV